MSWFILHQRTVEDMDIDQQKQVTHLLSKYFSVFSKNDDDIGRTGVLKHRISTADGQPIKQILHYMQKEKDEQIDNMLRKDDITPLKSPWYHACMRVKKKEDSK